MSEGLSQDDFRKLLQTPRATPANEEAPTPRFKAPPPKTPQVLSSQSRKPLPKPDDNYRDRAAERRSGQTSDASAEQLLRGSEADETLDAKQVYDQSKYLGGDVSHTHLVKGLDFSLLHKVREDLEKKKEKLQEAKRDADAEEELDDALERIERGESLVDDETTTEQPETEEAIQFDSIMAKNIYDIIRKPKVQSEHNEFFVPGRMAFVFELADEVGHYNDAFAIPTTIIRSKADVVSRRRTMGWSDDMEAESRLVLDKVSQVMSSIRSGERHQNGPSAPVKAVEKPKPEPKPEPIVTFDGDIFEGVGRDYELDEEAVERSQQEKVKGSYFTGLYGVTEDKDEDVQMTDTNTEVSALLSQATERRKESVKRRRQEEEPEDVDARDIDMFGLSTSVLPTSFEERKRMFVEDEEMDEDGTGPTSLVDQGSHRNKKAQLTRWDFDDEEEWQKYKDSVEIHPKSAFQFGVKLGDGRKRNREQRKGMSDKQKLNREYQQVKNLMEKKYGKQM
ncbi:hypothetical protein EC973_006350 [Apophysomyces ossiformis]|uniref:Protein Red n=1 Tax=Apophysomyces ossiformis TaxID=679940 RepID=A0A8H7BXU9_9FUNG|nr:hypothetical protein EC973_006350 [Apophysomyces ossiformis]